MPTDTTSPAANEYLSQEELCHRLGLCPRQVRNLTGRGMPREQPSGGRDRFGRYPWPRALAWYLDYKSREAAAQRARRAPRGPNARRKKPKLPKGGSDRFIILPLAEALQWFDSSKAAKASQS